MCEIFGDHWGYTSKDLNYKSPAQIICELAECRKTGANMLLNVGPKPDGTLRNIDAAYLELIGDWMRYFGEAVYSPRPTGIAVENKKNDFILRDGSTYYLFCFDLPMISDPHVAINGNSLYEDRFVLSDSIKSVYWMDDGSPVEFEQKDDRVTVHTVPFRYGRSLVVRVAKIEC